MQKSLRKDLKRQEISLENVQLDQRGVDPFIELLLLTSFIVCGNFVLILSISATARCKHKSERGDRKRDRAGFRGLLIHGM